MIFLHDGVSIYIVRWPYALKKPYVMEIKLKFCFSLASGDEIREVIIAACCILWRQLPSKNIHEHSGIKTLLCTCEVDGQIGCFASKKPSVIVKIMPQSCKWARFWQCKCDPEWFCHSNWICFYILNFEELYFIKKPDAYVNAKHIRLQ